MLRKNGHIKLEFSDLNLVWTSGKLTQTAVMMNPEDKLENNTSDAKMVSEAENRTAVYFVKWFRDLTAVNSTLVTTREAKQNTTVCHPLK